MTAPKIGHRPRFAPNVGTSVDWSHPLAPVGGWGALPGTGLDFFGHRGTMTVNTSIGQSLYGRALASSSASTGGIQFPFPAHLRNATAALTLVTLTSIVGLSAGNSVLLIIRDNVTDANPFLVAGMFSLSGTTDWRAAIRSQTGTYSDVTIATGGMATGTGMRMYVQVIIPPVAYAFRDGAFLGSATLSSSPTGISYPTTPPGITVGGYGTAITTQGIQGTTALALIYPRALTFSEIGALYADPFGMMRS